MEGEGREKRGESKPRKKAVKTNSTDSAELCMGLKFARYCPSSFRYRKVAENLEGGWGVRSEEGEVLEVGPL